jgi:hypothetical protein
MFVELRIANRFPHEYFHIDARASIYTVMANLFEAKVGERCKPREKISLGHRYPAFVIGEKFQRDSHGPTGNVATLPLNSIN